MSLFSVHAGDGMSVIFEEQDIYSFLNRLKDSLTGLPHDWAPKKSRLECFEDARISLRRASRKDWVRPAVDLVTYTLFHTERVDNDPEVVTGRSTNLLQMKDFEHWDQLCNSLSEAYGNDLAELKFILITGAVVEMEVIVSREVDGLNGPYKATQSIEAWIRHSISRKPRSLDIQSVKNLVEQYNHTSGTPLHELVATGLSNTINLNSMDDMICEYEGIFVHRRSEHAAEVQGIAIFAVSYKHEDPVVRMSKRSFLEV